MAETTAIEAAEKYRAALLSKEATAAGRLTRAYGRIYKDLSTEIDDLLEGLWDAETGSYRASTKAARLKSLKRQIAREIDRYGAYADTEMLNGSQDAITQAMSDSRNLTQLSLPGGLQEAGIMAQWNRLPTESVEQMLGFLSTDSPLHDALIKKLGPEVADRVSDEMVKGIALGWNPRKVAAGIVKQFGAGLTWSMTTVRTAQIWSYRESTRASYAANPRVVKGWVWNAALDQRTCMSCIAMHGTRHELSEPLDDHHSGRCLRGDMLVDARAVKAFVSRRYVGDMLSIRLASGQLLAVTPNHPILTDRGWVAAHLLREGDNIVSSRFEERTALGMSPYKDKMPTLVKDIPAALGMSRLASVPCSAEDFHGDGKGSDIYVVRTNSLLANRIKATSLQPFCKQQVGGRCVGETSLSSDGDLMMMLSGVMRSAASFLRDSNAAMMFLYRGLLCKQLVGLGLGAAGNVSQFQMPSYDAPRHTEMRGEAVLRFASDVAAGKFSGGKFNSVGLSGSLDSVVGIDVQRYDGHVYNLHTSDGWYNAGSSIAHNGRCVNMPIVHNCAMIPETVSYRDLGFDVDSEQIGPVEGDGQRWFEQQPEGVQKKMMGAGAFDEWKAGNVKLADFSTTYHDPVYGTMRRQATLGELVGGASEAIAEPIMPRDLEPEFRQAWDSMTGEEAHSFYAYQGNAYETLNERLRQGKDLGIYEKHVDNIDSAIARGKLGAPVKVYRGSSTDWLGDLEQLKGAVLEDGGFMSTSVGERTANRFAASAKSLGKGAAIWDIEIPKGTNAMYIVDPRIADQDEKELLLPRGGRLEIIDIVPTTFSYDIAGYINESAWRIIARWLP